MTTCVPRLAVCLLVATRQIPYDVQFDEYISAALASVKYADFIAKGEAQGVVISGTGMCTVLVFS